jgi:hypothetical protein
MKVDFERGLVLDQIGAAEAKSGDLDAAAETAIRAYPHITTTLRAIGVELGNSNDLAKAKSLASQLSSADGPTVLAFMAERQADQGRIGEAFRTAEQIEAPEMRSGVLERIATQQLIHHDYTAARKTIALAKKTSPAGPLAPDESLIQVMIMDDQLKRGDKQTVRSTIAALRFPETRFSLMSGCAEVLLEMGDRVSATAWLNDALRQLPPGPKYDFYRYAELPTQVKFGMRNAALAAAGALPVALRAKGYLAVAVACAEANDIEGVDAALAKMKTAANLGTKYERLSDFAVNLNILNVTAALIDHGHFEAASRLLTTLDADPDDVSTKMGIEPNVQLQRAVMLAQQGSFESARTLALQMRPNSVSDSQRGTALRTIAVLETRKNGTSSSKPWALALAAHEDRAYALLGIAQRLLEIDDLKLPYSAIQVH